MKCYILFRYATTTLTIEGKMAIKTAEDAAKIARQVVNSNICMILSARVVGTRHLYQRTYYYESMSFGSNNMRGTGIPVNYIRDLCQGSGVEFTIVGKAVVIKPHIAGVKVDDEFVGKEQTAIIQATASQGSEEHDLWIGPVHFNLEVFEVQEKP